MNTDVKNVWDFLSGIPIGTIVAWVIVIASVITAIVVGITKLYKVFTKYRDFEDEHKNKDNQIQTIVKGMNEIKADIGEMKKTMQKQQEVNFKQLQNTIIMNCNNAIKKKGITSEQLRFLEDTYKDYEDIFHGNSYVKGLMMKVRKLPLIDIEQ